MNRQDLRLAVVHKVVADLRDVGKTKIQKIVYFIQAVKSVPVGYSFKMHHYGPFAEDVETDTARLRLGGHVEVHPDHLGYGFHITPGPLQAEEEWLRIVEPYEGALREVLHEFGESSTSELELLATIHYVHKLSKQPTKNDVLFKVKSLKPKFDLVYVDRCYTRLDDLGYL